MATALDNHDYILNLQGGQTAIQSIQNLPDQILSSFLKAKKLKLPKHYKNAKNIIISGMGGSRFPALIVKRLFKDKIYLPLSINNDYFLPGWANKETLLILSSYSGTTEEILNNLEIGLKKKCLMIGITGGGKLAEILDQNLLPVCLFDLVYNPSQQPRLGFGYSFGSLVGLLFQLNFLDIQEKDLLKAIEFLRLSIKNEFSVEISLPKNPAKRLASQIHNYYPYLVVDHTLFGIGNQIANQINETSKNLAVFREIPELNHHLMEGLKHPKKLKSLIIFVFFFSSFYSKPIQKRFRITKEVVEKNRVKTLWIELKGKNILEQALYLMGLGSFLSLYLSVLNKENPNVIPFVDYFKKKLKQS